MNCILLIPLVVGIAAISSFAGKAFQEVSGIVSMEAENATSISRWNEVSGKSAKAMRDQGGSLTFSIEFKKAGNYYVYTLARKTDPNADDKANDCYVTLNSERLYGSDNTARPEGIRCASYSFTWTSLPKGPGSHTPENIKYNPVYAKVAAPATYTLIYKSRSPGFEVDKIVLSLIKTTPSGTGPAETVKGTTAVIARPLTIAAKTESPKLTVLPSGRQMSCDYRKFRTGMRNGDREIQVGRVRY